MPVPFALPPPVVVFWEREGGAGEKKENKIKGKEREGKGREGKGGQESE